MSVLRLCIKLSPDSVVFRLIQFDDSEIVCQYIHIFDRVPFSFCFNFKEISVYASDPGGLIFNMNFGTSYGNIDVYIRICQKQFLNSALYFIYTHHIRFLG